MFTALLPALPPTQRLPGLFPEGPEAGEEVDHTPPFSTELKNDRTGLPLPPYALTE